MNDWSSFVNCFIFSFDQVCLRLSDALFILKDSLNFTIHVYFFLVCINFLFKVSISIFANNCRDAFVFIYIDMINLSNIWMSIIDKLYIKNMCRRLLAGAPREYLRDFWYLFRLMIKDCIFPEDCGGY